MSLSPGQGVPARTWLPLLILVTLGLLWGGVTNVARYIGLSETPPLGYAFWTVLIGAVLLTMANIIRRQRVPVSGQHLWYFLIAGTLTSGLPTANMFLCLNYISVGAMSLVLTMVPLVTYLLSFVFALEQPNLKRASGIGLGLLGALLVVLPENGLPSDQPVGWFILAFLSPVGYAAGNVYTAKCRPADIDSLAGANGMMCASALLLLIATLVSDQWFVLWGELSLINGLIVLHGVVSAVAFTLFFVLVRIAGPVYFSQVAYLVTFFGIGIAMVVFGERYSLWHWAALVLTVCGVWLVNSAQKQITTGQSK